MSGPTGDMPTQDGLPVLGLAVTATPTDALLPLLGRLSRWCLPRLLDAGLGAPAAVLAASPRAAVPAGLPVAVLVQRVEDLGTGCAAAALRVLTTDEAVLAAAGDRGVWLPAGALPPGVRHVAPWVRERLRRARGLPSSPLLVQQDGGLHWRSTGEGALPDVAVGPGHVATALATCAAAATADPDLAVLALAWGAPLVTDPATARTLGATPAEVVVVDGSPADRAAAAGALADDPHRAAALSRAGRLLAERRHDLGATAAGLAGVLLPRTGPDRATIALDELGTPAGARIRARLDDALAGLTQP